MNDVRLHLVPVRSREAKDFVRAWHRHHPPPVGLIFAVGAADETGTLRAVSIVGRPVARHLDDRPLQRSPTSGSRVQPPLARRNRHGLPPSTARSPLRPPHRLNPPPAVRHR
ncbi:XF1762 family protein [Streptomyces sp. NPDC058206]|uniref:XF1762 family protein n=1 Tax=Streptomyces sp. NPDC058206 TaxID=3346382 RepID=UPI0036E20B44